MSAETFLPLVGHGQLGDGGRGEELAKGPPVGQTLAPPPGVTGLSSFLAHKRHRKALGGRNTITVLVQSVSHHVPFFPLRCLHHLEQETPKILETFFKKTCLDCV